MSAQPEKFAHILNDLITINKNRVTGYKEAAHELREGELLEHCKREIRQSELNNEALKALVHAHGGEVEDKTSTSGFIYNMWMDLVYGDEKEPAEDLYRFCVQIDETSIGAYNTALREMPSQEGDTNILEAQLQEFNTSLTNLSALRSNY